MSIERDLRRSKFRKISGRNRIPERNTSEFYILKVHCIEDEETREKKIDSSLHSPLSFLF